jgi:trans-2,3-dihydro-3-hydroxyanthranilate isomerase
MRSFRYVVADVFTDRALAGNQLAVFTDARDLDELTMQELALEIGFSESVFVLPPREGGTVRIRIHAAQRVRSPGTRASALRSSSARRCRA